MRRRFLKIAGAANAALFAVPYQLPPSGNKLLLTHNRLTLRNGTDRLLYRNGDMLQFRSIVRLQLHNAIDFLTLRN